MNHLTRNSLFLLAALPQFAHADLTLSVHSYYEGQEIFQARSPISIGQGAPTILSEALGQDRLEGQFEVNLVEDSELIIDLSATLTNTIEHGDSTSVYSPQIRLKEVALANSSTCFESVYLSYDSQFNGEMVGVYSIDVCVLKS